MSCTIRRGDVVAPILADHHLFEELLRAPRDAPAGRDTVYGGFDELAHLVNHHLTEEELTILKTAREDCCEGREPTGDHRAGTAPGPARRLTWTGPEPTSLFAGAARSRSPVDGIGSAVRPVVIYRVLVESICRLGASRQNDPDRLETDRHGSYSTAHNDARSRETSWPSTHPTSPRATTTTSS